MHDSETIVAWILFWLFTAITTIATFLITDHHRSRRQAVLTSGAVLAFFVLLFLGLRALLASLGL